MAMSTTRLQFLLAQTPYFQARVEMIMISVANVVCAETGVGADHAARWAFARNVLMNPQNAAQMSAYFVAQSTNVAATITMEDEGPRTSVTDAAMLAGITADWNKLAGIDKGS